MPGSIDPVPTGSMGGSGRFARSGIGGGASTVTDDVGVVEAGVDDVGVDDVGVAATAGGGGVTAATGGGELGGPAARTGRQTVASLVGGGVAATAGGDIGGGAATVTDDVGVVEAGGDDVGVDDVGVAATAGGGGVTAATAGGELGGPAGGVDDVGVVEAGVDIVPAPVHLPNTSALRTLTMSTSRCPGCAANLPRLLGRTV